MRGIIEIDMSKRTKEEKSIYVQLVSNSNFDIQCDKDNLAYLHIDTSFIFFHSNDDLKEFVNAVRELEIANDRFQSDRKEIGCDA